MSWFGKVVGGSIGFIIGGPLGAAGGAYLGHKFFDEDVKITNRMSRHEQVQANYFVALFSMLGKIAKADGQVTPDEVNVVDEVIKNKLRLGGDQRKFAIRIFNESKNSNYSFDDFAQNFYRLNQNNPNMLSFMLTTLFEVAAADGKLHPAEEALLDRARDIFRVSNGEYENLKKFYFKELQSEKHYAVLNCSTSDSDSTIKSNYRKLVQEFHPDKITNKGLPEEFKEYAKKKFQEIQDAYDYIRAERNF